MCWEVSVKVQCVCFYVRYAQPRFSGTGQNLVCVVASCESFFVVGPRDASIAIDIVVIKMILSYLLFAV